MSASNPIAEISVLSLMIQEDRIRRTVLGEGIASEHFTTPRNQLFTAIERLHREGSTVDAAHLYSEVLRNGWSAELPVDEIDGIACYASHSEGLSQWLTILRKCYALRIAQDASKLLASSTDNEGAEAAAKNALEAMRRAVTGPKRSKSAAEAMKDFQEHINQLWANGDLPGISTGIDPLDIISGGMKPGELWVSMGQSSRGKSVLMLQIAAHVANAGRKVAIFSAEMMGKQLFGRMVSNTAPLHMQRITQPKTAAKAERDRMAVTMKRLAEMQFWIDDTPGMTLEHIEGECARLADAHDGLDLIVVDYLQIVKIRRERNESREQEVARISNGMKQLAKARGCPVLTGAQFNKKFEARESEAIVFDSDCLLGICEDGIKVMKLRDGRRDDVLPLFLNGEFQRFERQ